MGRRHDGQRPFPQALSDKNMKIHTCVRMLNETQHRFLTVIIKLKC